MLYLRFQNIDMTDARFLATFWMQYAVIIAVWYVFIWFMGRKK